MLKFGVISEIDASKGLARVFFGEDDFVSGWLKVSVPRSGSSKFSFPYDINEHVYCIMDEDWEYGVVAGAIYDESNLPIDPAAGIMSWDFADGSTIIYDHNSHTLNINIEGDVNINCKSANLTSKDELKVSAAKISFISAETEVTGVLKVSGAAIIQGTVSMGGLGGIEGASVDGGSSEIKIGKLTASGDIIAGDISLLNHLHTSATPGSPTSRPIT